MHMYELRSKENLILLLSEQSSFFVLKPPNYLEGDPKSERTGVSWWELEADTSWVLLLRISSSLPIAPPNILSGLQNEMLVGHGWTATPLCRTFPRQNVAAKHQVLQSF